MSRVAKFSTTNPVLVINFYGWSNVTSIYNWHLTPAATAVYNSKIFKGALSRIAHASPMVVKGELLISLNLKSNLVGLII